MSDFEADEPQESDGPQLSGIDGKESELEAENGH